MSSNTAITVWSYPTIASRKISATISIGSPWPYTGGNLVHIKEEYNKPLAIAVLSRIGKVIISGDLTNCRLDDQSKISRFTFDVLNDYPDLTRDIIAIDNIDSQIYERKDEIWNMSESMSYSKEGKKKRKELEQAVIELGSMKNEYEIKVRLIAPDCKYLSLLLRNRY